MKVTTHRIILEGTGEHTFLIDGDKINEVLISVSLLIIEGIRIIVGKGILCQGENTIWKGKISTKKL